MPEPLLIVHVYPNLLGTYGDAGNALVLAARAWARGIAAQVVRVEPGEPLPRNGNIYVLGGGEDAKQTAAAQALRLDGALAAAASAGAAVFGVCAGYQILGENFPGVGGVITAGLELLDVSTARLERRAVGDLGARSGEVGPVGSGTIATRPAFGELIGFENHGGGTRLGPGVRALGVVEVGVGNGDGTEGAVAGSVVGTYLHGPALALNPALADWLLRVGSGTSADLAPIDDTLVIALREHRRHVVLPAAARGARTRRGLARLGRARSGASGASASLSGSASQPR